MASNTFNLFKVDEELKSQIIQYPPLLVPFGSILNKSGAVLFNQKIGSVDTDYPLFSMNDNEGQKTAILLGTGIWKW